MDWENLLTTITVEAMYQTAIRGGWMTRELFITHLRAVLWQ